MRRPRPRTAALVLALGLTATACSTGGDGAASSADASDDVAVAIDGFRFAPETASVPAGTTVVWTNEDATRHTVTAGDEDDPRPDDFDLEVDEQGDVVEFTFDDPGTYAYFCELHPFMTGTIEVTG